MLEERKAFISDAQVRDKIRHLTATTSLNVWDQVVEVTASSAVIITLPNVSEAKGKIYSIGAIAADLTNTVTVADNDESLGWAVIGGDFTLNGDGEYVVLRSNGESWELLASNIAGETKQYYFFPFDCPPIVSINEQGGGAATGATGDENLMLFPEGMLEYHILGAGQTILQPHVTVYGLDVELDASDNEGLEITPAYTQPDETAISGVKQSFVVGTDPAFYFRLKFSIADVSVTDDCAMGFRKNEAYQANIDDYDEMAALNVISGDIKIETILNNGATTTTDTTDDWADGETHNLLVKVSGAGVVTYEIDGAAPTTTAAFTFDTGEEVIPFFYFLHASTAACAVYLKEWEVGYQ